MTSETSLDGCDMSSPNQSAVEELYRSGVAAIEDITTSFIEARDWQAPACGEWNAAETVRHLVGVVDWYHDWLDRALDGDPTPPFSESEFNERNAARVAEFEGIDGPAATERFSVRSTDYLDRASKAWDVPYGFPAGTTTVGLHVGIAATEWHLHAWDLTAGRAERHQPAAPTELFKAAGAAMAEAKGGLQGRLLPLAVPLAAKRSPWRTILKQSGRS